LPQAIEEGREKVEGKAGHDSSFLLIRQDVHLPPRAGCGNGIGDLNHVPFASSWHVADLFGLVAKVRGVPQTLHG
jgi:hypothetical protein